MSLNFSSGSNKKHKTIIYFLIIEIMKKIFSLLALFWMFISTFWNNVYAVVWLNSNTVWVTNYSQVATNQLTNAQLVSKYIQVNNWNFLEKFQWQDWVYKVNFKTITPQNAGQVQAIFASKQSFPKKFVLPEGFTYEVKTNDLNKEFVKTNTLISKVNILKRNNVDIWKLKVKEPILQILPDRIQYIKRAEISFNTDSELKNIKKYLWKDFNFSDWNLNKLWLKLNQDAEKSFWNKDISLNPLNKRVTENDVKKAFDKLKRFWRYTKNANLNKNYDVLSVIDDNKIYADLIRECKAKGWDENKCNINELKNNSTKTLTLEDKVEYSLIPTTLEDIKNNRILIKYNPINNRNVFNLSKSEIYSRFVDLRTVQLSGISINKNFIPAWPAAKHDIEAEDYCDILHEKDWEAAIQACKDKQEEMKKITKAEYENVLLNWFTLWESKNYSWWTSLSVWVPFVGSVKVFSVDFWLYYSYWFGIRIPIKVKWIISDNIVNDFKAENALFTWSISVDTFDWSGAFYRNVWLPESKVFRWKEFVFELSAWANINIWVKYLWSQNIEIPFISMLATIFGWDILDSLWLESDADIAALWIPWINTRAEMLWYIITHNGLDQSKDFVPPFAWSNKIRLFKFLTPEIPFYNNWVVKFVWKAWVKSDLDGRVTMKCEWINSNWGCPTWDAANSVTSNESNINIWADSSRIHINTRNSYIWHWKAIFNKDNSDKDELWFYSKFWLNFYDFRYHPVLLFTVFIRAWIGAHIPLWVGWKTYWTPDIDIYTFKFSSDALYLWAHDGVNDRNTHFEMLDNNKIYSTVSTLTDIESINVSKIWWKFLPRSVLTILPEDNYAWANSTYYRIDWNIPYSQWGTCSKYEENWTFEYNKPVVIWPNAKNELVNSKTFRINVKSCDRLILWKAGSEKKKSLDTPIVVNNYYHKVFPSWWDDITLWQDWDSVISPLRLEEMDEIKATANVKCTPNFKLYAHPENKAYYIMYNIVPKNNWANSSVWTDSNASWNLWLNVNYYTPSNTYLNSGLATEFRNYPKCDWTVWKLYKWEDIVLTTKWAYNNDPANRVFVDTDSIIYAVKCIWKTSPNVRWNVFTSLITKIDLKLVNGWLCEDEKDDMQHWDLWWVKDMIDRVTWIGNVKFWDYWFDMQWVSNMNVWNVNVKWQSNFKWNINWDYFWWVQTFWINPQNQNPWENQNWVNKNWFSIPELQEKKPWVKTWYSIPELQDKFPWLDTYIQKKSSIISNDEYVNDKLDEINQCFLNTYNNHLKNIDDTIRKFNDTMNKSSNKKTKQKYAKAIKKLEEIKRIFILRYKNIIDYKNWIYNYSNNWWNSNNVNNWVSVDDLFDGNEDIWDMFWTGVERQICYMRCDWDNECKKRCDENYK